MEKESGNSSGKEKMPMNSSYEGSNHTLKQYVRDTKEVTRWFSFGIQLGIKTPDLKEIEKNCSGDTERCRIEVIDYWLSNDPDPTQSKLAQAVEDMGGHANVVQTLRASYEGVPQTLKESGHISCKVLAVKKDGSVGLCQQSSNTKTSDESSGYQSASQPESSHEQPNSSDEQSDSSDEPATPVDCTCGNCHLYTLCTRGCSNPGVGSGIPLPIWNGTGKNFQADYWQLTEYERELSNETKEIVKAFANLVTDTSTSFAQKVKLDVVVLWLRQLEVIKPLTNTSISLSETMEVDDSKNMEQLFKNLSKYWSWYNYYLLKELIEKFGDKKDETKLKEYLGKFTSFLKKRLPSSQDSFSFGTRCRRGQKQLLFKVDQDWDTIPLGQIRELHHKIAEIVDVQPKVLYLSSVSKGCICLEFLVPESMAILLCASQKEALMAVDVFRLECGEYVWQDPDHLGHADRPEEEDNGYEGCSEGESDIDLTSHPQAGKHTGIARRTHGRGVNSLRAGLPEGPDVVAGTVQLHSSEENEGHEQELQIVVTKEDEQLKKGGSTREVQDVVFLDHDHSTSSMADEHSAEAEGLPEGPDVSAGTKQLHSLEDEWCEHAMEIPLQNMIAMEDEQPMKECNSDHTRAVLNYEHPASSRSIADPEKKSAEAELQDIGLVHGCQVSRPNMVKHDELGSNGNGTVFKHFIGGQEYPIKMTYCQPAKLSMWCKLDSPKIIPPKFMSIHPPQITQHPTPQHDVVPGLTVKFTVIATGGGNLTYKWQRDGADLNPLPEGVSGETTDTLQIVNVKKKHKGTYMCIVSNTAGPTTSKCAQLTVLHPPQITQHPTPQHDVVPGLTVKFTVIATGGGNLTYKWQRDGADLNPLPEGVSGETTDTLQIVNVKKKHKGTYTCIVSNTAGPTTSKCAQLTVFDPPQITQHPTPLHDVVPGITVKFTVIATGDELMYKWQRDGADLNPLPEEVSGETTDTLQIVNVKKKHKGTYTCIVSNTAGPTTSKCAHLTVLDPPQITQHPTPQHDVVPGITVKFTVIATGDELMYKWQRDGADLNPLPEGVSGETTDTLQIVNVKKKHKGTYTCIVSNTAGPTTSKCAQLTVLDPPQITQHPTPQYDVVPGLTVKFTVIATGGGNLTYKWQRGGADLNPLPEGVSGETTDTLQIVNVKKKHKGTYTCIVSNTAGPTTSKCAQLTVLDPPQITQHPTPQHDVVPGITVKFTVIATGDELMYKWQRDGADLNPLPEGVSGETTDTLQIVNVKKKHKGTYTCIVSNTAGPTTSKCAQLTVCALHAGGGGGGVKSSGKVQPPDQKTFEREINAISRQIKEKQAKLPLVRSSDKSISTELSRITVELAEIDGKRISNMSEVCRIEERVNRLGTEITQKTDESSKLVAGLRHKSEERIDEVVSKLEQQLQTKQFPATEEGKLQTEIDNLKKSKERLREYLALKEETDRMRIEHNQLRKRRDSLYRLNRDLRTQETERKDHQIELRQQQEEIKEKSREAIAITETLIKEIDELYQRRQQLRSEFRRQQMAYLDATREEWEAKRVQSEEDRKARGEAHRRKHVAEVMLQRDLLYEQEKGVHRILQSYLQNFSVIPSTEWTHTQQNTAATVPSTVRDGDMFVLRRRDQDPMLLPASNPSGRRKNRKDKKRSTPGSSKNFYESKLVAKEADSEAGDSGFGITGLVVPFNSEHELTSQDDFDLFRLSPEQANSDDRFLDPNAVKSWLQDSQSSGTQDANSGPATPTQADDKHPSISPPSVRSNSSATVVSNGSKNNDCLPLYTSLS